MFCIAKFVTKINFVLVSVASSFTFLFLIIGMVFLKLYNDLNYG